MKMIEDRKLVDKVLNVTFGLRIRDRACGLDTI